ncbi:hypothetical protein K431DRAFT_120191 [Polychaeton citri CBS 116435]|uniref:Uncharacterized protein n=1 Tax=Polychaeton citri CBS 116435 TaxID=1314669 RepID=A0A9P4UNQ3_9PEZI|nr:hypothetical protein K431DRAFT_120191 [Polychaeton citri CBS 116435]
MDLSRLGIMPSVSPPTSPTAAQNHARPARPPSMKRHSSASSAKSRQDLTSPGSNDGFLLQHKPRKAGNRHARVVLPRNHSSGRNLARLAQQTQRAEFDARKHTHRRSHEGDTEIRLPGSLDESRPPPPQPPPMRRNMTAFNLPRSHSHVKLKKNMSHGQLARAHSGRNLAALSPGSQKMPQSPGSSSKGKAKRPKSADMTQEKDLHQQEVELLEQQQAQKEKPKRVGFAVGDTDMSSEGEDESPEMEGSGFEEGEWTEDSNSASPYSTKQNTANNSRRASVVQDKPPDKPDKPVFSEQTWQSKHREHIKRAVESAKRAQEEAERARRENEAEEEAESEHNEHLDETDEPVTTSEEPSPGTTPAARMHDHRPEPSKHTFQLSPRIDRKSVDSQFSAPESDASSDTRKASIASTITPTKPKAVSPLAAAKPQPDPNRRLLNQRTQQPAPALVSNISTLDDVHSNRGSPAQSIRSSKLEIGTSAGSDETQEELVSRFLPSQSHPSLGISSGVNTAYNTPKQGGFHILDDASTIPDQQRERSTAPTSPGSTMSGSSGAATPAAHRSRIDMKMALEKHQAKIESEAERQPLVPVHVYDRRNESLKSWLNLNSVNQDRKLDRSTAHTRAMGPELFQGRFKAVNQELKVVQKYQDPIRDALHRLKNCKGSAMARRNVTQPAAQRPPGPHQAAALRLSRSAVTLPQRQSSKVSTSASPPTGQSGSPAKNTLSNTVNAAASHENRANSGSAVAVGSGGAVGRGPPKRAVSFKETNDTREVESRNEPRHLEHGRGEHDRVGGIDDVVQKLWELPALRQTQA